MLCRRIRPWREMASLTYMESLLFRVRVVPCPWHESNGEEPCSRENDPLSFFRRNE